MQNRQNRKKRKSTFIGRSAMAGALLIMPVAYAAPTAPTSEEVIKIEAVVDETDAAIEPVSLVEAIAYALDHSPQRQAAWSAAEAAKAQIKTAKSAGGLQVGLTGNISRQWGHGGSGGSSGSIGGIGGIGGGASSGQTQGWRESLSVDASLPIYTGGRVKGNKRMAEYVFQTSIAQAISTEQDLIYNTTLGYLDILRTKQLVDVNQADLDVARERLRVAQVRFDAGASPRLDVLRAETDEATATQNLVASQNALNQARANLNTIMGRRPQTPLRVQPLRHLTLPAIMMKDGRVQDQEEKSTFDEDADLAQTVDMGNLSDGIELFDVAGQASPTLQALRAQFHSAEAAIDVAKSGRKPQVGINISDVFSHPASFLGRFILSLGGSVVQNLFDSGKTRSEITAARATADQLRNSLYAGELSVANQIEQSLLSLNSALERETTSKTAVVSAQEALRSAQLGYSAGVQTTLDVSDAEAALLTAQTNAVNARFDVAASQAQLAAAVGVLTVEGERAYRPSESGNELRPISEEKSTSESESAQDEEAAEAENNKEQRQARRK